MDCWFALTTPLWGLYSGSRQGLCPGVFQFSVLLRAVVKIRYSCNNVQAWVYCYFADLDMSEEQLQAGKKREDETWEAYKIMSWKGTADQVEKVKDVGWMSYKSLWNWASVSWSPISLHTEFEDWGASGFNTPCFICLKLTLLSRSVRWHWKAISS